jgi:hypothetical protein
LDDEVAEGGGLDGAGEDGALAGVGCELVEELILGSAADDVDGVDAAGGEGLEIAEDEAVGEGEGVEAGADVLAGGFGDGLVCFSRVSADLVKEVAGGGEAGVMRIVLSGGSAAARVVSSA